MSICYYIVENIDSFTYKFAIFSVFAECDGNCLSFGKGMLEHPSVDESLDEESDCLMLITVKIAQIVISTNVRSSLLKSKNLQTILPSSFFV